MFSFFEEIAVNSGLPFSVFNNGFKVINFSNKAVYLENYKNILTFEQTQISIKMPTGITTIEGDALKIKNMNEHSLIITGNIKTLNVS